MPAIFRAVVVTLLSAAFLATFGSSIHAQGIKPATTNAQWTQDIDRDVWSVLAATVAADDIVRMGETYFPNAVVVTPNATSPLKETLDRWGKDMVAAKAKGNSATVEFRFSRRQDDAATAFEAGIFKYTVIEKSGTRTSKFYPFEALLGKANGKWRVLMERQFAEVTQAEWNKLAK
jgi:hypothetical protein